MAFMDAAQLLDQLRAQRRFTSDSMAAGMGIFGSRQALADARESEQLEQVLANQAQIEPLVRGQLPQDPRSATEEAFLQMRLAEAQQAAEAGVPGTVAAGNVMQGVANRQARRGAEAQAELNQQALALQAAQAQQNALLEQDQLVQQRLARVAPIQQSARNVGMINEIATLNRAVGTESLPTQAAGRYGVLRDRLLNALRQEFEAGALQQAELEFFESLLPEFDAWTGIGAAEREAQLAELAFWFNQTLEDRILLSGLDVSAADFADVTAGRSLNDLMTAPVPPGLEEIDISQLPDRIGVDTQRRIPGAAIQPGQSIF